MADEEARDLLPDLEILRGIFQHIPNLQPQDCTVVSNTWENCNFFIRVPQDKQSHYGGSSEVFVRLEVSDGSGKTANVAVLQKATYRRTSESLNVVPVTLDFGTIARSDGSSVDYSVTEYYGGTVTLEHVWDKLSASSQQSMMDSIVGFLKILQQRSRSITEDESLSGISELKLDGNLSRWSSSTPIGGPSYGYFPDVSGLLSCYAKQNGARCSVETTEEGIVVKSIHDSVGEIKLSNAELAKLKESIVLCHHDVEPRNILVRPQNPGQDGQEEGYDFVAVIDWECAGFYPFSFEVGHKDTVLGSSNLSFSWYSLFKTHTADLIPPDECHEKMIKAMEVIHESKKKSSKRNIGLRFQNSWIEREHLLRSDDPRGGWIRANGATDPGPFTKEDKDALELEVLKKLGYA